MRSSILCGVDGSADAQAAIGVAARLAERLDARLVLAHVAPIPSAAVGGLGAGSIASRPVLSAATDEQQKAAERLVEEIAREVRLPDADLRGAVGFAAERLADLADEENAELIVVGSRGRGAIKSAFLGSVSHSLLGFARCPVLIVPAGAAPDAMTSLAELVTERHAAAG